eukprot:1208702-Lingulodinium_polyedra.AAC.1
MGAGASARVAAWRKRTPSTVFGSVPVGQPPAGRPCQTSTWRVCGVASATAGRVGFRPAGPAVFPMAQVAQGVDPELPGA